ncbi:unnamed protein product [Caenorhabditis auriculariae]|uniref:Uncharacterized protein n=1 Tax=Caenorhabditis auriculariae TaxID=2777116 RepID=A0A8S1HQQ4_9PELO|nr:unnamed protein product [Caenorhabditis auriculariae]
MEDRQQLQIKKRPKLLNKNWKQTSVLEIIDRLLLEQKLTAMSRNPPIKDATSSNSWRTELDQIRWRLNNTRYQPNALKSS